DDLKRELAIVAFAPAPDRRAHLERHLAAGPLAVEHDRRWPRSVPLLVEPLRLRPPPDGLRRPRSDADGLAPDGQLERVGRAEDRAEGTERDPVGFRDLHGDEDVRAGIAPSMVVGPCAPRR